jgi:hypothetical protein
MSSAGATFTIKEQHMGRTTPEGRVKKMVRAELDRHGVYYFMPPANGFGRSGIPDFVCCVNGRFLSIECKAGNNEPTALQNFEMGKIREAGGTALVINEDTIPNIKLVLSICKRH